MNHLKETAKMLYHDHNMYRLVVNFGIEYLNTYWNRCC